MAKREILFRGKLKDKDEWIGEWIEGIYCPCYWDLYMRRVEKPRIIILSNKGKTDGLWREVLSETVGQYTGLVVANGKVFDGDYLKFGAYILEVFWNGETFQWQAGKVGRSYDTPFRCCGNYRGDKWTVIDLGEIAAEPIITGQMTTEIVGNRWDNPELIPKTTQYEIEF